jgi:hypothetical protein
MRSALAALSIAFLVPGCASTPAEPATEEPSFLHFLPGQDGGLRLTAPYGGILTQRGRCLGLLNDGFFSTVIWPETARISFDRRGLILRDTRSGASARLGDLLEGTGGGLPPRTPLNLGPPVLNYVMPIECARRPVPPRDGWIGMVNPGFRKAPPVFLQYRPGQARVVRLTARYGGYLTQRGKCLGILNGDLFTTIFWPETAEFEFDRRGPLLKDRASGARLRLGDYVVMTGGPLPPGTRHPLGEFVLNVDTPMECAHYPGHQGWLGMANPGFRKARPPRHSGEGSLRRG